METNDIQDATSSGGHPEIFMGYDATTNQFSDTGFDYDASGNMTDDPIGITLTYDAENRLTTRRGTLGEEDHFYDGSVLRIKRVADPGGTPVTTVYIYSGTKVIAEYVGGTLDKEYIYLGSTLLATIDNPGPSEVVTYHHADHLSARINTDSTGAKVGEQGHYPFGEDWDSSSTANKWGFTNYERESAAELNYATFRFDSSRLGRFMTPDPLAGSIANPQSLNRYGYVVNDPINLVDPLGLDHEWVQACNPDGTGCIWVPLMHDPIKVSVSIDGGGGGLRWAGNSAMADMIFRNPSYFNLRSPRQAERDLPELAPAVYQGPTTQNAEAAEQQRQRDCAKELTSSLINDAGLGGVVTKLRVEVEDNNKIIFGFSVPEGATTPQGTRFGGSPGLEIHFSNGTGTGDVDEFNPRSGLGGFFGHIVQVIKEEVFGKVKKACDLLAKFKKN